MGEFAVLKLTRQPEYRPSVRSIQRHKESKPEDPGKQGGSYQLLSGDADVPQFHSFAGPDLQENGGAVAADIERGPVSARLST